MGTFVNSQERAHAVASAMKVCSAIFPQSLAAEDVELLTRGAFREDGAIDRNLYANADKLWISSAW